MTVMKRKQVGLQRLGGCASSAASLASESATYCSKSGEENAIVWTGNLAFARCRLAHRVSQTRLRIAPSTVLSSQPAAQHVRMHHDSIELCCLEDKGSNGTSITSLTAGCYLCCTCSSSWCSCHQACTHRAPVFHMFVVHLHTGPHSTP